MPVLKRRGPRKITRLARAVPISGNPYKLTPKGARIFVEERMKDQRASSLAPTHNAFVRETATRELLELKKIASERTKRAKQLVTTRRKSHAARK